MTWKALARRPVFAALASVMALATAGAPARASTSHENSIQTRADALLARMTPEQKAAQLTLYFAIPNSPMSKGTDQHVIDGAGALLFVSDAKEINRLQRLAIEKSPLGIPMLFAFDVVHGLSTIFPVPIGMAASWDPEMVSKSQAIAAAEARGVGITWTFAPVVDIARDPRWGRMVEGAGEDPYLTSAMGAAQVRGFQGPALGSPGRIIAGPKHFAGYGASLGGRDYDEASISDEALFNTYLPPFKAAVDAGAGNIMTAYMPLNGIPATANRWLLTNILRKQWGFTGWVVSDNSAVGALSTHGLAADRPDAAVRALQAGLDMEMVFDRPSFGNLATALAAGKVSQQQLDDAVKRVLGAKLRLGLFEKPFVDEAQSAQILKTPAHLIAARIAAERSAVLLKNEGSLLPLDRRKLGSIAVIGPLADSPRDALGPWVFPQNNLATQSILAGIREKAGPRIAVNYVAGVKMGKRIAPSPLTAMEGKTARPEPADDTAGIAEAVAAARAADVAIMVLGETHDMIGELASSSSLNLSGRQQELVDAVVATGKPVAIVLMNGRPLDLKDTKAQAILDIWYPGSQGGSAAANLLFGDAVPGGKLPFTWPRNAGQVPMYYSHLTTHDPKNANSRYWNEQGGPVYPFGHGLSYTSFAFSNLKVDRPQITAAQSVTISVDLKNTGERTGDEVAQLYIHQRSGTAARPVRELKGFSRVTLKPGEVRTVRFTVGPNELRYWNAATRDWVIDSALFDVAIGGSSAAPFGATFSVAAEK